jgi:hypothetical protein
MAPRAGFEPATCRLTVECSTAELPGNSRLARCERGNTDARLVCQAVFQKKCHALVFICGFTISNGVGTWRKRPRTRSFNLCRKDAIVSTRRAAALFSAASRSPCRAREPAGSRPEPRWWAAASSAFCRSSDSGWCRSVSSSCRMTCLSCGVGVGGQPSGGIGATADGEAIARCDRAGCFLPFTLGTCLSEMTNRTRTT